MTRDFIGLNVLHPHWYYLGLSNFWPYLITPPYEPHATSRTTRNSLHNSEAAPHFRCKFNNALGLIVMSASESCATSGCFLRHEFLALVCVARGCRPPSVDGEVCHRLRFVEEVESLADSLLDFRRSLCLALSSRWQRCCASTRCRMGGSSIIELCN